MTLITAFSFLVSTCCRSTCMFTPILFLSLSPNCIHGAKDKSLSIQSIIIALPIRLRSQRSFFYGDSTLLYLPQKMLSKRTINGFSYCFIRFMCRLRQSANLIISTAIAATMALPIKLPIKAAKKSAPLDTPLATFFSFFSP